MAKTQPILTRAEKYQYAKKAGFTAQEADRMRSMGVTDFYLKIQEKSKREGYNLGRRINSRNKKRLKEIEKYENKKIHKKGEKRPPKPQNLFKIRNRKKKGEHFQDTGEWTVVLEVWLTWDEDFNGNYKSLDKDIISYRTLTPISDFTEIQNEIDEVIQFYRTQYSTINSPKGYIYHYRILEVVRP